MERQGVGEVCLELEEQEGGWVEVVGGWVEVVGGWAEVVGEWAEVAVAGEEMAGEAVAVAAADGSLSCGIGN